LSQNIGFREQRWPSKRSWVHIYKCKAILGIKNSLGSQVATALQAEAAKPPCPHCKGLSL